jgi:hypothetical protein
MATVTYIILPDVIRERMSLHDNIEDKNLYPEIKAVQDLYIMPLLGSRLFDKILNDLPDNLDGYYKTLMDDYLVMAVCNFVMSELPEVLNYQYWNKGVATKTAENTKEPTMSELYSLVAKYKNRAEHYTKLARAYLVANVAHFPEYNLFVSGTDLVPHENSAYTCPIYLGDETEAPRSDYSLQ